MFLYFSLFVTFVPLPERPDALLASSINTVEIESSGSLGLYMSDSKCRPTYPNNTLISERRSDWCSNVANDDSDKPWISFRIPKKSMKINSYAVRNGCCDYLCCCNMENGKPLGAYCCCRLFSFSLLGSNDNKTWTIIHKVEKDESIKRCEVKTFNINVDQSYSFIKFVMDKETPGCLRCMQINQIEFYGSLNDEFATSFEHEEDDETISIIGKVKH